MPRYTQSKMCNECPFRFNAPPGWLGPWKPDQIVQIIQQDENFICHKAINRILEKGGTEKDAEQKGQHCVGMLRYMNAMLKRSRNQQKAQRQTELKNIPDQDVINPPLFKPYHSQFNKITPQKP
jgi:agmatine/peptidylarginine deiminase